MTEQNLTEEHEHLVWRWVDDYMTQHSNSKKFLMRVATRGFTLAAILFSAVLFDTHLPLGGLCSTLGVDSKEAPKKFNNRETM